MVYLPRVGVLGGLSFVVRELWISISVTVESYTGFVNLCCRSLFNTYEKLVKTNWDNVPDPALPSRNPSRWIEEAVPVIGVVTYCPPLVFLLTWVCSYCF